MYFYLNRLLESSVQLFNAKVEYEIRMLVSLSKHYFESYPLLLKLKEYPLSISVIFLLQGISNVSFSVNRGGVKFDTGQKYICRDL